jgi:WS/DGAT/MGAT family acyltransferase
VRIAETLGRSLPGMSRLGEQLRKGKVRLPGGRPIPRTRLNGKVGPHRVWDSVLIPLDDIRSIKDAVPGATVNDVVLSIVGGALRAWLSARGELPKETLTAMAPISVRSEGEKGTAGNRVSAMAVALGTHLENPLERLRLVHQDAVNSKALTEAVGAKALSDVGQLMPAALAALGARLYTELGLVDTHAPSVNCVVTNVPGPREPLYFCGSRMVSMAGMGPVFDGMGLINAVYSYAGGVSLAFTAERDMMPDPQVYADGLRSSFEALRVAAQGATTPRKRKKKESLHA